MDITPLAPSGAKILQGYGDGGFRISGVRYEGAVLLFPFSVQPWAVSSLTDITLESLRPVLEADPKVEILLLGTGTQMELIAPALRRDLRKAGVIVDVMDTGAACRTYSVLMLEGRAIACALLPA